jgi:hypothetical protein
MGAWTEIVDFTFTANETSRAFTGLNITKDDFIKIVMTHVNASTSTAGIRLFPNTTAGVSGFDTNTNYHTQFLSGNGSTVSAVRENFNEISAASTTPPSYSTVLFKLSENGKTNSFTNTFRFIDSGIINRFAYTTSSNLTFNDPITSLTFSSSVSNGLATGSRIQIYRLDAEKVADITTTSNATQVDISDLSIGKDSEYLLVSDFIPNTSSSSLHFLTPNDLTTQTNYHMQEINGSGSSAGRGRSNNARIAETRNTNNTLAYTHIKLSEIGAFTAQSYEIRQAGTANIILTNYFVSSTAENITSITKLNVGSSVSNQIKSGSRFILYKLK